MYLLHPGMDCTEATISQHYYWNNLRGEIGPILRLCKSLQKNRKQNKNCGLLYDKEEEVVPWDKLAVDIIGSYKIIREGQYVPLILKYLTMLDLVTRWFEIL